MKDDVKIEKKFNQWQKNYQESLERHPECKNKFENISGLSLKPLYTPLDAQTSKYNEKVGFPGEYPYTRGIYAGMYRTQEWTRRMLLGYEMPETFNRRQKALLAEFSRFMSMPMTKLTNAPLKSLLILP